MTRMTALVRTDWGTPGYSMELFLCLPMGQWEGPEVVWLVARQIGACSSVARQLV